MDAGWDGTHVLFSQTPGRQKYKNLQQSPAVALSIVDPANAYRYLEIRDTVTEIVHDPGNTFINSMAKKHIDQDVYPWRNEGDHRVIVKVLPEKTTQMG